MQYDRRTLDLRRHALPPDNRSGQVNSIVNVIVIATAKTTLRPRADQSTELNHAEAVRPHISTPRLVVASFTPRLYLHVAMSSAAPEVLVILSIFFIANGALGFCVVGLYVQTIPRHGSWKYPFWMLWCVNLALDVAGTGLAAFCLVELQAAGRRHEADAWAWIADILAGLGRLGLLVRVFLTVRHV